MGTEQDKTQVRSLGLFPAFVLSENEKESSSILFKHTSDLRDPRWEEAERNAKGGRKRTSRESSRITASAGAPRTARRRELQTHTASAPLKPLTHQPPSSPVNTQAK